MKFDVIIGNPPYQLNDGGGTGSSAKPIYNLFVEKCIKLNPDYLSLIIPSRWMQGGKGLSEFRERMKKDKRLKLIKHFDDATGIFDIELPGGVMYFIWNKNYSGLCDFNGEKTNLNEYDIILLDKTAKPILDKVIKNKKSFMSSVVYSRNPFGVISGYNSWCIETDDDAIKCYTKGMKIKYINKDWVDKNNIIDKWKVCTSKANGAAMKTKNWKYFVCGPKEICTETYLVISVFNNENDAESFIKYTETDFFKFMLNLRMISQNISKDNFAWVPDMQDYTKEWTDKELYKHFDLTQDEINYIEKIINVK